LVHEISAAVAPNAALTASTNTAVRTICIPESPGRPWPEGILTERNTVQKKYDCAT
jgi:hypothetical protein